jgi:hypothetical protein
MTCITVCGKKYSLPGFVPVVIGGNIIIHLDPDPLYASDEDPAVYGIQVLDQTGKVISKFLPEVKVDSYKLEFTN